MNGANLIRTKTTDQKYPLADITIQSGYSGREATAVMNGGRRMVPELRVRFGAPYGRGPVIGSVEFCEQVLGFRPVPDFYPTWLSRMMHREVYLWDRTSEYPFMNAAWFMKSAERYKLFDARVFGAGELYPAGALWLSQVVQFVQEWRYYVADGEVLANGWYDGCDPEEAAPELGIEWPKNFCGAVDFGYLSTGELALVESHHPYACGWYGDDHVAYTKWVVAGWEYMKGAAS